MKSKIYRNPFLLATCVLLVGISIYRLNDCGPCLQEQDYQFMDKIKSSLDKVGDTVKVSDVHSGNWQKVCIYGGGYDQNLASSWEPNNSHKADKAITNKNNPFISEKYDESAIVFFYGENEIEIYRMTPDKMAYQNGMDSCYSSENSYFSVKWNEKYAASDKEAKRLRTRSHDYMAITIISKQGGKK